MNLQLELLLAARYLRRSRDPERVRNLRYLTLGLLALTLTLYGVHAIIEQRVKLHFDPRLYSLIPILRYAKYVAVLITVLVGFFVELIRKLTIFTTISTFGLFLGTGALVTVLSVMSGFEHDLKRKILGTHAHMVVAAAERSFSDYKDVLARVERIPGVLAGTPYLTSELIIASPSGLSGVIIKGIDPATIGKVTDLVKNTDVGSLDHLLHPEKLKGLGSVPGAGAPAEPRKKVDAAGPGEEEPRPPARERRVLPGVVLGRELAKNLRVYLADDVNIISPMGDVGPTGPIPKAKPFRVAAIFFSGMYEYDSKYVYMALPAAQRFLGVGDEVTGLELKLADPERSEELIPAIRQALGKGPDGKGYEVDDWKRLNRSLFSALKLEKIAMFIGLCFIILVATFSIVSNGIMLVLEKGKEIAILKSMGITDGAVLRVFVLLGLYMGLLGSLVGIVAGCAACLALDRFGLPLNTDVYYITQLPVSMNPRDIVLVLVASLILATSATLYPAWLAARLRPVDGLR